VPKLELDDVTVHYDQFGSGPDLVWLSGGGGRGQSWHRWHVPYFEPHFRCTTFDNRGIGETRSHTSPPWTIADMAHDAARVIEALCEPPVAAFGQSMGAFILLQLALDRPELLRCAIASGAAASGGRGWLGDYMGAEVELRRRGGKLDGMFAVTHYAAQLYPARVLGDPEAWERIKQSFFDRGFVADNEASLIPQWQACIDFDVVDRLPGFRVPLHVFAYDEDVQAPPQNGEEIARLVPGAELHLFAGMGHGSLRGHTHDVLNPIIKEIVERYP
jgi:pimeloyl-ACP methyl ester carboxylesterase